MKRYTDQYGNFDVFGMKRYTDQYGNFDVFSTLEYRVFAIMKKLCTEESYFGRRFIKPLQPINRMFCMSIDDAELEGLILNSVGYIFGHSESFTSVAMQDFDTLIGRYREAREKI